MKNNSDSMNDDYSALFAKQVPMRGKYYEQAMRAKRLVELDPDLLQAFPTKADVNAALHGLVQASKYVHFEQRI